MPATTKLLVIFLLFLSPAMWAQGSLSSDTLEILLQGTNREVQIERIKTFVGNLPYDEQIEYLQLAITLARDRELKHQEATLHVLLGQVTYGTGDYVSTLDHYQKALDIFESLENWSGMGRCYNEMAIFVKKQKDYTKALSYLDRSLMLCQKGGDSVCISTSYDNRGLVYAEQGQWQEAEKNYLKTLEIRLRIRDSIGLGYVYNNLAEIESEKNNFSKAISWIEKSNQIRQALGNITGLAINITNTGELYFKQGQFEKAAANFEKSLQHSRKIAYPDLSSWNYQYASKCYAALGQTEKALEYLSRSYELKDSLLSEKRIHDLAEMETRYETQKKEQQIQLQQLELANQAQKHRARLTAATTIVAGLLLCAMLAFFFYRNRQKNQLRERELAFQQQLLHNTIEVQEDERKRIAKDLHDGIGQQLTGLKMAWQNLSEHIVKKAPEETQQLGTLNKILDDAANDVRVISHQMMPRALRELGLLAALEDLVDKSFTGQPIKADFNHHGISERLPEKIEVNLYRMIQELINNVLKHSGASEVDIQLYKNKNQLLAIVEDNGKGFLQEEVNPHSHGMVNINSRIRAINGMVDIESSPGSGTVVTLKVPLVV